MKNYTGMSTYSHGKIKYQELYSIRSIKNTLPTKYLRRLYQILIQPHIEYGIIIWGSNA
jgi:hypothetical protein